MTLSLNAVRALEQVKMVSLISCKFRLHPHSTPILTLIPPQGLFMLYGADYFTEDEWIKIDGFIHKGNYVFTRGPPGNVLEAPLINFEESKVETKLDYNVQIQAIESPVEKELVTITREQV